MNSPSPKEAADSKSATPQNNEFRELIKTLILAFVFALVFRSFAYEPFHIPSGSMKSNLLIGDYIFISKF